MGLSNNFKVLEHFFISIIDKIVTMHFREGSTVEIGCDYFFFFQKGEKKGMRHSHIIPGMRVTASQCLDGLEWSPSRKAVTILKTSVLHEYFCNTVILLLYCIF